MDQADTATLDQGRSDYHPHPEKSDRPHTQWKRLKTGAYRATGPTWPKLPAGAYLCRGSLFGDPHLVPMDFSSGVE